MIRIDLVQKAIIGALRADVTLMALLGNDTNKIIESQFQGLDIGYPRIAVNMNNQPLVGNGVDRKKLSRVFWSVEIFSESRGSQEANKLMGQVFTALFNTQIIGTDDNGIPSFRFLRVDNSNQLAPLRLNNRLWKAEIFFESELYPTTDNPLIPT